MQRLKRAVRDWASTSAVSRRILLGRLPAVDFRTLRVDSALNTFYDRQRADGKCFRRRRHGEITIICIRRRCSLTILGELLTENVLFLRIGNR